MWGEKTWWFCCKETDSVPVQLLAWLQSTANRVELMAGNFTGYSCSSPLFRLFAGWRALGSMWNVLQRAAVGKGNWWKLHLPAFPAALAQQSLCVCIGFLPVLPFLCSSPHLILILKNLELLKPWGKIFLPPPLKKSQSWGTFSTSITFNKCNELGI